jgi:hypothetical protein
VESVTVIESMPPAVASMRGSSEPVMTTLLALTRIAPQLDASTPEIVTAEVMVHEPVYFFRVAPAGTPVLVVPGQPAIVEGGSVIRRDVALWEMMRTYVTTRVTAQLSASQTPVRPTRRWARAERWSEWNIVSPVAGARVGQYLIAVRYCLRQVGGAVYFRISAILRETKMGLTESLVAVAGAGATLTLVSPIMGGAVLARA